MNSLRKTLTTAAVLAITAGAGAQAASAASLQSPTGNIVCVAGTGLLSCDVKSADVSYSVSKRGHAWVDGYHGFGPTRVAAYGWAYHLHGFTCVSETQGMSCSADRTGHGFFLSRETRYRF